LIANIAQPIRQLQTPRFSTHGGLLTRFIGEKLAQHVEPTRLGTPRGVPIGFSRKKMAAALFALTTADVKETAREVRVSYGLIRKWRTEVAFKALVVHLEDEFVERFCTAVDGDLGVLGPVPDPPGESERPRRAAPRADFGVPIPVWELGLRQDANLDQVVDALYTRRRRWVATNLGDVRLYGARVLGKLAQHLLDEREGVGRPGRMSVAHALAALRHQAVPSPEMLELGARALFGIVRFIVLVLESASSQDRRQLAVDYRTLATLYLRVLQRQLVDRQP
jgi:hypothetical protein